MDFQLAGTLILSAVAIPYGVEILRQLPLLTRIMSALPAGVRATLPRHPRDPRLAAFGSARFFVALFRYLLRDGPDDPVEVSALKRRARWSFIREMAFGAALAGAVMVLWHHGWRPPWPRTAGR